MLSPEFFGGQFLTPPDAIKVNLKNTELLVFDWDGVFNNGYKTANSGSGFTEADSMGLNMLRFSFWLETGTLPAMAIITGEDNETARWFAKREKFNALYSGVKEKDKALTHICDTLNIKPTQAAVFFDDIADVPMASLAGSRFLISRTQPSAFMEYVIKNHLADYVTAKIGGQNALRETAEMIITLHGNTQKTIVERSRFSSVYNQYLAARSAVPLHQFTPNSSGFTNS